MLLDCKKPKLHKLDNLKSLKVVTKSPNDTIDANWKFGICRMRDINSTFYWSSHIIYPTTENWIVRYTGGGTLQGGQIRFENSKIIYSPRTTSPFATNNSEIHLLFLYYYD